MATETNAKNVVNETTTRCYHVTTTTHSNGPDSASLFTRTFTPYLGGAAATPPLYASAYNPPTIFSAKINEKQAGHIDDVKRRLAKELSIDPEDGKGLKRLYSLKDREQQQQQALSNGSKYPRSRIATANHDNIEEEEDVVALDEAAAKAKMTKMIAQCVNDQRQFWKTGATRSVEFRREQLKKLKKMIEENAEALCDAVHKDLRRPKEATKEIEVMGSLGSIDHCLKNLDEWCKPQKLDNHPLGQPVVQYEPKGVVLIFTAWNYPTSLAFQPMAEAIAAGNTVILKPSEVSENASHLLKKLLDATFDKKVVMTIEGGPEVAAELLEQRFDHIFYTGSSNIGKLVMAAASKNLTPVTLELGGKCPVLVEPDADLQKAAKRIAEGKWLNSGQTCIAPDYIMTNDETKPKLVKALQDELKTMFGADAKLSPHYSRMVNQRHFDRVKTLVDASKGKLLYKGGDYDRNDVFIPPILVDAPKKDRLMEEEVFGPVLPIVSVKNMDEAIQMVNDGEKPLAAYLFTKDQKKVDKFLVGTSSGGVCVNDTLKHVFIPELPFGGVGTSGMGSYHGKNGFIALSHAKSVLVRAD